MFEGFRREKFDVGKAVINFRLGGNGPALLLLHGFPQTHVHWHAVAPLLEQNFTLVIPDLRGYGESTGPAPDSQHRNYSKRAMAEDMVAIMDKLGHQRFRVAGHDRGARVAYRLTLDHPGRVTHLASLDTVPTLDIWESMDMKVAIDLLHDQEDRETGRKISCPVLALRGGRHTPPPLLPTWRNWAVNDRETNLDCGHFIAEEDPEGCAVALRDFFVN